MAFRLNRNAPAAVEPRELLASFVEAIPLLGKLQTGITNM